MNYFKLYIRLLLLAIIVAFILGLWDCYKTNCNRDKILTSNNYTKYHVK